MKPIKEFEQAIEKALDSMLPLKALQTCNDEYGHLFSRKNCIWKVFYKCFYKTFLHPIYLMMLMILMNYSDR